MVQRKNVAKETFTSDSPAVMELWDRTRTIANQINVHNKDVNYLQSEVDKRLSTIAALRKLRWEYIGLLMDNGAEESIALMDDIATSTNIYDENRGIPRVTVNQLVSAEATAAELKRIYDKGV